MVLRKINIRTGIYPIEIFSKLQTLRVGSQKAYPPNMIETGTLNHEGIAGEKAAVEFVADIGAKFGNSPDIQPKVKHLNGRRRDIVAGLLVFDDYEQHLTTYLIEDELDRVIDALKQI